MKSLIERLKAINVLLTVAEDGAGYIPITSEMRDEIIQTIERQETLLLQLGAYSMPDLLKEMASKDEIIKRQEEQIHRLGATHENRDISYLQREIARKDKLLAEAKPYVVLRKNYLAYVNGTNGPDSEEMNIFEWLAALEEEGKK